MILNINNQKQNIWETDAGKMKSKIEKSKH